MRSRQMTASRRPGSPDGGSHVDDRSGLADGLALDLNLDLLADHDAARLDGHVPGQAPVLTVDLGGRAETEDILAVRADRRAVELDDQLDRLGHILDGELTVEDELGAGVRLDTGAAELD